MSLKKKAGQRKIKAKRVEDLPVSILADIAAMFGCRIRFDLLPRELCEPSTPKKKGNKRDA